MKKFFKIVGGIVGLLVIAVGVLMGVASMKASARLDQHFESHRVEIPLPFPLDAAELAQLRAQRAAAAPPPAAAAVPTDDATTAAAPAAPAMPAADPLAGVDLHAIAMEHAVARGKHLIEAQFGCNVCHGKNFAGGVMIDDPAIGSIHGPNITAGIGGRTANFKMSDWDRIVRHGIKTDGHPAVMPSEDFFSMSDRELSDVVAYIKSQPTVDIEIPRPSFGPLGKVLLMVGKFPISAEKLPDHMRAHALLPPPTADTPEFGEHLASICTTCHRANLAGGPMTFGPPDWPPSANLTQDATGLKGWSFEDFEKTITTGVDKNDKKLREPMTLMLEGARNMTSTERHALWTYLSGLPPTPTNK